MQRSQRGFHFYCPPFWPFFLPIMPAMLLVMPLDAAELVEFLFQNQRLCGHPFSDAQWVPVLDLCEVNCHAEKEICMEDDQMKQSCRKLPEECVNAYRAQLGKISQGAVKIGKKQEQSLPVANERQKEDNNRNNIHHVAQNVAVRPPNAQRQRTQQQRPLAEDAGVSRARSKKQSRIKANRADRNQMPLTVRMSSSGILGRKKVPKQRAAKKVPKSAPKSQQMKRRAAATLGGGWRPMRESSAKIERKMLRFGPFPVKYTPELLSLLARGV